jgi:hypothetical protein
MEMLLYHKQKEDNSNIIIIKCNGQKILVVC